MVLTEVLPYEVPPNFSNVSWSRFLRRHEVRKQGGELTWKPGGAEVEQLIKLVSLIDPTEPTSFDGHRQSVSLTGAAAKYTIPLELEARRANGEMRVLSVPHPSAQLRVVEYYQKHETAILDATSRSSFSLRRPAFIARFTNVTDRLHDKLVRSWEGAKVEEVGREYRSLHSYFSYRNYSNVYKFHESREFQTLEQSYRLRVQVDVKQCFRSIYTHSITWATHGKHLVKDHLRRAPAVKPRVYGETFAEAFDTVMQKSNYNETNGILIGPEYSRIFAEIILQRVDVDLLDALSGMGLNAGVDYDVRRYVDDYYVFAQDQRSVDIIVSELRRCLAHFNLHLNDSKTESASHPSISPISIAKSQLRDRLREGFGRHRSPQVGGRGLRYPGLQDVGSLITDYKIILASTGAPASALANYALSAAERTLVELLRRYVKKSGTDLQQGKLAGRVSSLMTFIWFVYSTCPMLSPTVKVLRVIDHLAVFLERESVSSAIRGEILDSVSGELKRNLLAPGISARLNIERIYLLHGAERIGRFGLLEPDDLAKVFGIRCRPSGGYEASADLDYFGLMALLAYCGKRRRYEPLRKAGELAALKRFDSCLKLSAERIFLGLDFLACPYVGGESKARMANLLGITGSGAEASFFQGRHLTFHDWRRGNLGNALDMKRSLEVY